jgi:hypothetical protein
MDKKRSCSGCLKNCLAFLVVAVLGIWSLAECSKARKALTMTEADYKIDWTDVLPSDLNGNIYPRRWALARRAIQDLAAERKDDVLVISLEDKRAADLCKSAIYSESSKIRKDDPHFKTTILTDNGEDGVVLYVTKEIGR